MCLALSFLKSLASVRFLYTHTHTMHNVITRLMENVSCCQTQKDDLSIRDKVWVRRGPQLHSTVGETYMNPNRVREERSMRRERVMLKYTGVRRKNYVNQYVYILREVELQSELNWAV